MSALKRLPYPGLRAFTRDESDLFFGRDGCVDAMVNRLAATRFLSVLGSSGSGKSSLVRTGLLDALDLGLHPWAGSRWTVVDFHPGSHPLRNLSGALLAATEKKPPDASAVDLLATFLRRGPRSLAEWVPGGSVEHDSNLLLIVDQFEELFRYGNYARQEEAEAFTSLLLETAILEGVNIHIVVTMRSEFLGASALMPGLAEKINAGLYLTSRMTRDECREAIEGPAGVMGFSVEPALVNRLLNDLGSFAPWEAEDSVDQAERLARRADQLPLMQHVLNRLWVRAETETAGSAVVLRLSDYDNLGGLSGAIDAHGEEVLSALGIARTRNIETVFRSLVSGTGVAAAVRRPCRVAELVEVVGDRGDVVAIVEAFSAPDCNFLRTSEQDLSDDVIVDISHESLIRQWSPLRTWLENEARDAAAWRRLAAAEERYAKGEGGLLTGLDLQNLAAWWESASPTPAWGKRHGGQFELVEAYLTGSLKTESMTADADRRRQRRERSLLIGGVLGLLIALAIVGTLSFSYLKKNRETADANRRLQLEIKEADQARKEADREKQLAQQMDANREAVLGKVGDIVYSDRYRDLVGVDQLQIDLAKALLPYQTYSEKLTLNGTDAASLARDDYRQALAFESVGDAQKSLTNYREAYEQGRRSIENMSGGQAPPESVLATFIKRGSRFAWFLFDIGERDTAGKVLEGMLEQANRYEANATGPELLIAFSNMENLESRYFTDRRQGDLAKRHSLKAVELAQQAMRGHSSDLEVRNTAFTLYRNRYLDTKGNEKTDDLVRECQIADSMGLDNPMDRGTIKNRSDCLRDQAYVAKLAGNTDGATEKIRSAEEVVYSGLRAAPNDQALLLNLADLEAILGNWAWGEEATQREHWTAAREDMIHALSGRTLFQLYTKQIKNLYIDCCKDKSYSDPAVELAAYEGVVRAVSSTLDAFPKAPSSAYVAADASSHVGQLLAKTPGHEKEAEAYLTRSIKWFDKSGVIDDLSIWSEDFSAYCGAYEQRARLFGSSGQFDLMLRDVAKMEKACAPALNKFQWDIYLRFNFLNIEERAGSALFDAHLYTEALPHLEYASHWGVENGTKLIARMYKDGLGVNQDVAKASELEKLAADQGMKRFTIPCDFGGIKAPFYIYVREWPPEYPYKGIEDQRLWLKEARGGTIPPEVVESFLKLDNIAREQKVSLPKLAEYALSETNAKKDETQPAKKEEKEATANPPTGPNERAKPQYDLAVGFIKKQKWAEAAQALENALSLDPESADILELGVAIYHDRLFQFDRAFELNARLVELGAGEDDFVESHLTTSRYESCAALAAVDRDKTSDKNMRLVMTALDFTCLSADHKPGALVAGRRLRKEVIGLQKGKWNFTGTKHFLSEDPAFAKKSAEWVSLFEALELGDEKKALAALTALGVPE